MPTWTLADVEKELLDTASFIAHRKAASQSSTSSDLELTLTKGIIAKINSLHLTAGQSLTLHKILDEKCSSFSKEMVGEVRGAIDAGMTQPVIESGFQCNVKPQLVPLSQYLTKRDWECIYDSGASHAEKVKVCTCRLNMLGVKSLHEQTVGHVVACLLRPCTAPPPPPEIYKRALDTKLAFQPSVATLPYVRTYPDDPGRLPAAILTAAYPCQEGPAGHIPANFTLMHGEVILRYSHKKLKKTAQAVCTEQPTASSSSTTPMSGSMSMGDVMSCMMNIANNFANNMANMQQQQQNQQQQHQQQLEQPKAKLALCDGVVAPPAANKFEPKLSAPTTAETNEPPEQPALPLKTQQPSLPEQASPQDHAAESVETAAFNALKNRSLEKAKPKAKGSAKGKAKAKAKGQAKAKAKASAQAQQSAGSNKRPLPEYEATKPEDRWEGKYDSWRSKHYHKARQLAVQLGWGDEDAKEFGKKARAQATVLYDQAFRA